MDRTTGVMTTVWSRYNSTQALLGETAEIHWADIVVIAVYFAIILGIGLWSTRRANRGSAKGYFLAGRGMSWWPVGASLFASNIGSVHFVGLAGTASASGIAVVAYEWNAIFILVMLGWIFVPVYISAGVFTMPEYLRKRFGGQRITVYLSVVSLLLYVFTKISADIFAGAVFIQQSLKWDLYLAVVLLLAITAVYTVLGGLSAVIWTDTAQTVIMIAGAFVLTGLSLSQIGGYEEMKRRYALSVPAVRNNNTTCGIPPDDSLHMFRDPLKSDLPWPGITFGLTILATWYWCTDQVIVQRCLAAKTIEHSKGGCILAGYLKILPFFLMILPGMISRALYPDEVGCVDPDECLRHCQNAAGCSNVAYPKLVVRIMPTGLRGLMLAVMLAALMSSLTSIFNSSSTIFTMDIWRKFRTQSTERELMIVGRLFVVLLVVISIVWIPIVQAAQGGQIFSYIQAVTGYLSPPICASFILGIFWKRMTEPGAFWGLMSGLVVGLIRLVMDFAYGSPGCGEPEFRPAVLWRVHFLYFAMILFAVSAIVMVVVSLCTPPIDDKHLVRLTWATRHNFEERYDLSEPPETVEMIDLGGEGETADTEMNDIKVKAGKSTVEVPSPWKRCFDWMCGISQNGQSAVPEPDISISIDEKPRSRLIININAVIMMCVGVFLWAFYA
ncbi:sodium/glucose cotransporter 4-like isoform X1 [Branchiostoma floridae]|uniref:Sodium/glucose cotransporter 4-like isoform X1 n=1 Tax=Branchiostoma floridae TaxID=7739 RepID=A0A9J7N526_BRAFL|nr:sodium/glucose cotransporter 4-like isoform X1 [Branchiostoma floridae]